MAAFSSLRSTGITLAVVWVATVAHAHPSGNKQDLSHTASDSASEPLQWLGANSPYFAGPDVYDISSEVPEGCHVEQAAYVSRHGSRYPDAGAYAEWVALYTKIQAANFNATGSMAFLKNWKPVLKNPEAEISQESITGFKEAYDMGYVLRSRYPGLYTTGQTFISWANQYNSNIARSRVVQTARNFVRGYLGSDATTLGSVISINSTASEALLGNSLAPSDLCPLFHDDSGDAETKTWDNIYLPPIAARFNALITGNLTLTISDVSKFPYLCGFESQITGNLSPFCSTFSDDELKQYEYRQDLRYYYGLGPGSDLPQQMMMPFLDSLVGLLAQGPGLNGTAADGSSFVLPDLITAFTNDGQMAELVAALGIFDDQAALNASAIPEDWKYISSHFDSMKGTVAFERITCLPSAINTPGSGASSDSSSGSGSTSSSGSTQSSNPGSGSLPGSSSGSVSGSTSASTSDSTSTTSSNPDSISNTNSDSTSGSSGSSSSGSSSNGNSGSISGSGSSSPGAVIIPVSNGSYAYASSVSSSKFPQVSASGFTTVPISAPTSSGSGSYAVNATTISIYSSTVSTTASMGVTTGAATAATNGSDAAALSTYRQIFSDVASAVRPTCTSCNSTATATGFTTSASASATGASNASKADAMSSYRQIFSQVASAIKPTCTACNSTATATGNSTISATGFTSTTAAAVTTAASNPSNAAAMSTYRQIFSDVASAIKPTCTSCNSTATANGNSTAAATGVITTAATSATSASSSADAEAMIAYKQVFKDVASAIKPTCTACSNSTGTAAPTASPTSLIYLRGRSLNSTAVSNSTSSTIAASATTVTTTVVATPASQNTTYIRILLNDAVYPVTSCQSGPGSSCLISEYVALLKKRYEAVGSWKTNCNATSATAPGEPKGASFFTDLSGEGLTAVTP